MRNVYGKTVFIYLPRDGELVLDFKWDSENERHILVPSGQAPYHFVLWRRSADSISRLRLVVSAAFSRRNLALSPVSVCGDQAMAPVHRGSAPTSTRHASGVVEGVVVALLRYAAHRYRTRRRARQIYVASGGTRADGGSPSWRRRCRRRVRIHARNEVAALRGTSSSSLLRRLGAPRSSYLSCLRLFY